MFSGCCSTATSQGIHPISNTEVVIDGNAEQARDDRVRVWSFFILSNELFSNVRKNVSSDENLNETLERIFKNIESSTQGAANEDDV